MGGNEAKGKEAATGGEWLNNLTKGFARAAAKINEGGEMTAILKVAAGDFNGDMGSGSYALTEFNLGYRGEEHSQDTF